MGQIKNIKLHIVTDIKSVTNNNNNNNDKMSMPMKKVQKVMVQPINLIFRYLQSRARIQIWLYEQTNIRIEGHIIGFDEYMNLVLDEAAEVSKKQTERKALGRILLKGDNITLMMVAQGQ